MTSRVTLSRILAVNWYGYRQFIEVSGLTLITGANGSGKSALLDLIQFVMLGEQSSRFNKAAAGAGSGRTLRGYCLCDTNTMGRDGQERYLRPSGVTLAGLEFSWAPAEDGSVRRETWGARIEFDSPTSKARTVWFSVPGRVEERDFLSGGGGAGETMEFLPEDEFRVRWKRDLQGEIWDRQGTYLDEMAQRAHLGFGRPEMNKTLPSAMAFQPVENFERFIRDYLLEPSLPDVRAVKASVDAHRRAQERLEKMNDQWQRLTKISAHHGMAVAARREAAVWSHLREALAHEEAVENLKNREERLEGLREEREGNVEARESAMLRRDELREQLEQVQREVFKDDGASRLDETRQRLNGARTEVKRLRAIHQTARDFLHGRVQYWAQWLRLGGALGVSAPGEADEDFRRLKGNDILQALDAVGRLARLAFALMDEGSGAQKEEWELIAGLEKRLRQVEEDLRHFSEGRSAASPLLDALRSRGLKAVALGRVVEVTPEGAKWWPLLEALLAPDRQAVLPEDFKAAWEVARSLSSPAEALLHPGELRLSADSGGGKAAAAALPVVKTGSLRQFVTTLHEGAGAWLDGRLGNVMPVRSVADLEKHERALSADGWLKDPPRRQRLIPEKELTLGENGLKQLRAAREAELAQLREELELHKRKHSDWSTWLSRGREWNLNDQAVPEGSGELRRLEAAEREADTLEETLALLATPEREAAVRRMRELQAESNQATELAARLEEKLSRARQEEISLEEGMSAARELEQSLRLAREESRLRVTGVEPEELRDRLASALSGNQSWRQRLDMASELARQRQAEVDNHLRKRDDERRALAEAHTELADAFDIAEPENSAYARRQAELSEQELPRFRMEAEKARRDWEERLQHQVLDVIREKLEEADRTKRELNKAMDCEIGGWRYQISSTADRAHSAIWTLVEKGLPSGEELELFNHAAREELEAAKSALMAAIEAADQPGEARQQRALDYRYYHRWRMMAYHVGRSETSGADLDKIAKKQSGGENQAPFFVATLAAFRRVYDLGQRQQQPNLGVVVMDEAFSKLSGDRIDDCLALARNFGLQLLMAFPEDRLPTMAGHADTIIQCRVERSWSDKDVITGIENWVIRVNRERLQEVMD